MCGGQVMCFHLRGHQRLLLLGAAAGLEEARIDDHLAKPPLVDDSAAYLLSLPVGAVQEGEGRVGGSSLLGLDVGAVVGVDAVAGGLGWRQAGGGAVSVRVLPFELVKLLQFALRLSIAVLHLLGFGQLEAGPSSGVHNMVPVLLGAIGQFLPSFHQQHAGIADVPNPIL